MIYSSAHCNLLNYSQFYEARKVARITRRGQVKRATVTNFNIFHQNKGFKEIFVAVGQLKFKFSVGQYLILKYI